MLPTGWLTPTDMAVHLFWPKDTESLNIGKEKGPKSHCQIPYEMLKN